MPFRFNARSAFLTYPKCDVPMEHALTMLRTKIGEAQGTHYLIAVEAHEDGTPHLHVFWERTNKLNTVNERFFDLEVPLGAFQPPGGYRGTNEEVIRQMNEAGQPGLGRPEGWEPMVDRFHPNVTVPRNRGDVIKYVSKHGNVMCWPQDWDWKEAMTKKRKGQWEEATPLLMQGQDARELLKTMPAFVLANKKKVEEAVVFLQLSHLQEKIPPLTEFLTWELPLDFDGRRVNGFLDVWNGLRDSLANMVFGKKQWYLHGGTGIGKSTWLQHLFKVIRVYLIPNEDFYDHWEDSLYDMAVIEEFKGQKPIQWLNQWLDGGVMNMRKKGSQAIKTKAVPTVILSNFSPMGAEIYPNMQETISIGTFRRRLHVVEVDQALMRAMTNGLRLYMTAKGLDLPPIAIQEDQQVLNVVNPMFVRPPSPLR